MKINSYKVSQIKSDQNKLGRGFITVDLLNNYLHSTSISFYFKMEIEEACAALIVSRKFRKYLICKFRLNTSIVGSLRFKMYTIFNGLM